MTFTGKQLGRAVGCVLAAVALLMPAGTAGAVDDPGPVSWPKVQPPESGGNQVDPGPVKWVTVPEPEKSGSGSDPGPRKWPAPQRG